ncbi:hypothetical protein P153DRAFT_294684 [Dothidotthia symphoricarpi CBS 119687]|uniref:BZIP domain-containing protein n=1 Tax=Dothidotthia symphoricarpi CBS 119687 TaxID=1392245 RepID=A0A6A6A900_9PLEO|nr:uncharacterized protein P153DRAFT_294684 [Dothidotthia symphoricarpi CBS 119687]KAF2127663.1 hypothetical protein P153DRAFT_294684 [Dothidotthia symphoricarpi CBS 119687]
MNAGIQNEDRRPSSGSMRRDVERARRRSSIRMNLNLADPGMPAPGEMQRRGREGGERERAPSLGELHQELEYEQEGQVNRLLSMIRTQQSQINTLQATQHPHPSSSSAVDDNDTPTSERSMSIPPPSQPHSTYAPQSAISPLPRSRSPFPMSISRQSSFADRSRGGSQLGSPALRPVSSQASGPHDHDMLPSSAASATGRDESAFYQAETQNLTRENQMLKGRIRELERQLLDMNPTSQITHSPAVSSGLGVQDGASGADQPPPSSSSATE